MYAKCGICGQVYAKRRQQGFCNDCNPHVVYCLVYDCTLSASACVARHRHRRPETRGLVDPYAFCRGCVLGEMRAQLSDGVVPDGGGFVP